MPQKTTLLSVVKLLLKEQKITNKLLLELLLRVPMKVCNYCGSSQPEGEHICSVRIPYDSEKYIKLDMKDTMTAASLYAECQVLFPCWKSDYLDLNAITSERKGNYTVYFKNVVEADEENKNLSADDIKAKGMKTITLEERLMLEIAYFKKTGKHLDIEILTLCTGSRGRDGDVPGAFWRGGGFDVSWDSSGSSDASERARSAVFLPAEQE